MTYISTPEALKATRTIAYVCSCWLNGKERIFNVMVPYNTMSKTALQRIIRGAMNADWLVFDAKVDGAF
jgi:hypothetical protein